MAQQTQYVLNTPLQVAAGLRYIDANGDTVTQLYPNDYLSLTGSAAGTLTTQYQQVSQILTSYANTLTSLQGQITAIQTSGALFIPTVNGGCLSTPASSVIPVDTATTLLIANSCAYNTVLGTTTALAQAILAEGASTLNTLPAFSQNSVMAGLVGWKTSPVTIADSINNAWVALNDYRVGISTALAAVTPTCSQVIIAYQAVHVSSNVFNIYFNGYTFIPSGYTDNTSTIQITDSSGGIYLTSFNIVTQSTAGTPLSLSTSGSTLSGTASSYTVQVNSNVRNTSLGLTCQKTVVQIITASGSSQSTFDLGNFTSGTTSASTYSIVSGLGYTPRFVSITPKNSFTSGVLINQNYSAYLSYVSGGATLTLISPPSPAGTFNIDWIAYR